MTNKEKDIEIPSDVNLGAILGSEEAEKYLNVNVTLGLIIVFLLSSGTIYGDTTDGKDIFIKESKEYNNVYTDESQLESTKDVIDDAKVLLDYANKRNYFTHDHIDSKISGSSYSRNE